MDSLEDPYWWMDDMDDYVYPSELPRAVPTSVSEMIANHVIKKKANAKVELVFSTWKRWSFSYIDSREARYKHFRLYHFMRNRMLRWRRVTKVSNRVGKALRSYWYRRLQHRFLWWKYASRYIFIKKYYSRTVFYAFKTYTAIQKEVTSKWTIIRMGLAAITIQKAYLRFRLRRIFGAMKTIHYFVIRKFSYKLIKMRRGKETKRIAAEEETVSILLRRAQGCLDDLMSGDDGQGDVILAQYLKSVKGLLKQVEQATPGSFLSKTKVFPTNQESPAFTKLWTTRAKAMEVLKLRCQYTVGALARARFRYTYPPYYECSKCAGVFLLRAVYADHVNRRLCSSSARRRAKVRRHKLQQQQKKKRMQSSKTKQSSFGENFQKMLMFRKESDVMDTNDFDGLEEGEEEEDEEEELIESSDSEDEEEMARRKGQEGLQKYKEVRKYALNGQKEPDYICWQLAEPIVDKAIRSLSAYLATPNNDLFSAYHQSVHKTSP